MIRITQLMLNMLSFSFHQEIVDISANCGTSFSIVVVAQDFQGKGKLARHKMGKQLVVHIPFPPEAVANRFHYLPYPQSTRY